MAGRLSFAGYLSTLFGAPEQGPAGGLSTLSFTRHSTQRSSTSQPLHFAKHLVAELSRLRWTIGQRHPIEERTAIPKGLWTTKLELPGQERAPCPTPALDPIRWLNAFA